MKKVNTQILIAEEIIIGKIFTVRGKQVMLSQDLAELYQVETKALNQQVKRNMGKFPESYMFQLTREEYYRLRSQNVTLKRGQHPKYLPYAFTEHGILMLSSVLNSERADKVSMIIVETFIKLREILYLHKEIMHQIENVQSKIADHDDKLLLIFEYLRQLEQIKQDGTDFRNRRRIGFNSDR